MRFDGEIALAYNFGDTLKTKLKDYIIHLCTGICALRNLFNKDDIIYFSKVLVGKIVKLLLSFFNLASVTFNAKINNACYNSWQHYNVVAILTRHFILSKFTK